MWVLLSWWFRQQRICLQCGRPRFDPWVGKIPRRREWLPIPVFWSGEFSPWDCKELDMIEQLSLSLRHCRFAPFLFTVYIYVILNSYFHGLNSPGQNTGMGSHSLLQRIFPTQGSKPGLLHCRRIPYQLSHKGSPRILEWVAYPFSRGSSQPRNRTGVSCIAGGFFTS